MEEKTKKKDMTLVCDRIKANTIQVDSQTETLNTMIGDRFSFESQVVELG